MATPSTAKHRLILCNDGGTLAGPTLEAPIGAEGLEALTITPLRGTQIDTLYWQLGTDPFLGYCNSRLSDTYSHNTKIGPRWGIDRATFPSASTWRIYENTRRLLGEGFDPPAVVIDRGRRVGLSVFLSMRFNDMHDGRLGDPDHPYLSATKRTHSDWLLGPSSTPWEGSRNHGFSRFAYNFAVPEVRAYKLALAREVITQYDLDGLDLDFVRFPRVFPNGTGRANADLITQMLRELRALLDEKEAGLHRHLKLSVRIPPTPELALHFGYDVGTWIRDGLVDIVIAGVVQGDAHRLPIERLLETAQGTDTRIIVQVPGFYHGNRPFSARVLFQEKAYKSAEIIRASALAYWRAGVHGIYLWNHHLISFAHDAGFDRTPWKEIGDPATIALKDKHYLVDDARISSGMDREQEGATGPDFPLPQSLNKPGDSISIAIDVADELPIDDKSQATFRVMIEHLTNLDHLEVTLNGHSLDSSEAATRLLYNHCWIDFNCRGLICQGWNTVRMVVLARNPVIEPPLTVESVEVLIRYANQHT